MNEKDSMEAFHSMPVSRAVFQNAVPAMIAMIMVLVYNLADTFFIGRTGDPIQVASITLAAQAFVLYSALGTVFGVGGTSVISRSLGAGNKDHAKKVSAFCVWGSVCSGLIFSALILLLIDPILTLLGADSETWVYTRQYISIVVLSGPFVVFNGCCSNMLRAEGQSAKAMMGQSLGNLTNIVLDPLLISGLQMGTKGAAIATVIGNLVGTAYYARYFLKGHTILSANIREFTVKGTVCTGVLAIGIPASLNTVMLTVSQMVLNHEMSGYGNLELAGMGVATNIMKIPGLLCLGFAQGVQPLVGYAVGHKDLPRCKKIIRFSIVSATVLSTAMWLLSNLFTEGLVGLFLTDPAAFQYGVDFAKKILTTSFLFGAYYVLLNVLQGFGAAKASLLVSVSRQGLIYIPALFLLQALFGMNGLVMAQPVADVLSTILVAILYAAACRRMKRTVFMVEKE